MPLNTTLAGNPTRGFIEVMGLRGTTTNTSDTAICTDSTLGGDVLNSAVIGRAYYVNPLQSPILAYGGNAVALKDFGATKLPTSATVLGNKGVAQALILQGTQTPGFESTAFGSRYFVDPSFGALTQVVTTFPTDPNSSGYPRCKVPASLTFVPVSAPGTVMASFARSTGSNLVNVFNVTNTDIPGSNSGVLSFIEPPGLTSIPLTGFVVQTTTNTAGTIFNVLFPLSLK